MFLLFSSKNFSNHRASGCPYECLLSGTAGSFFCPTILDIEIEVEECTWLGTLILVFAITVARLSFSRHPRGQTRTALLTRHEQDSNIILCCSIIVSFDSHSRWVHPKYAWSRNEVGSSISTFLRQFLPRWSQILLLSIHFDVIHIYLTEITLVSIERTYIPSSGLSPIQVLT